MCFSYECDPLFRCPSCLPSRVSGGAHLVFLFPRESLERASLKFSLQGGKVTALCLQEGEQVWALNIKRAVLSMLQTSRMASTLEVEKEVRVDEGCRLHKTFPVCKTRQPPTFAMGFVIKCKTKPGVINTTLSQHSVFSHSRNNRLFELFECRRMCTVRAPAGMRSKDRSC